MVQQIGWILIVCQVAFLTAALINTDVMEVSEKGDHEQENTETIKVDPNLIISRSRVLFDEDEIDDYEYSNENTESEEAESSDAISRSRVLFDEDEINDYEYSNENTESNDAISRSRVLFGDDGDGDYEYSEDNGNTEQEEKNLPPSMIQEIHDLKATNLQRKVTFTNPEIISEKIEMTLGEINQIFNKKKHKKNKKGKKRQLTQPEKKQARKCRKQKLLFSIKDKKCHEPTSQGPCKNNKWFVAVQGKLNGVCKRNRCTDEENPIMFNGTCSQIYGNCPNSSRLYINKKGLGFCDCDEGFSYSIADDKCYKEYTQGPCSPTQIWVRRRKTPKNHKTGHKVFGKCKDNECKEGEVEWKDKKCYKVDTDENYDMCADSDKGDILLENDMITCELVQQGRAVILGVGRSCRRGRTWSSYRNRCVRVFSRG